MKKLVGVLVVLVVLLVAAIAVLPALLDVNRYRDRIQSEMQKQLGRSVQLGQMHLSLLPPSFKVQNAVIGEDPKFNSSAPFAQTAELDIQLKLQPLLHKDIQVASLRMVRPQVELIRAADGEWNFSTLGTHKEQQSKQQQTNGQSKPLSLDRLQIDDGSVAVTDEQNHQPRMEYKDIDVLLKNFVPGQPFDLTASARLPGSASKQAVKFTGHGGPIEDATLISTPFDGTLQLDQVMLSGLRTYLNSPALNGDDATINGTMHFKNDSGKASSNGTVRMENVKVHNNQLGYPIELDYNASDDLKTDVITLSSTQLKVGSAPFVVSGTINAKSTPALADLKLNTQNAPIAELVKLASAFGVQLSPGLNPSGNLTADLTARGPLTGPAVAGTIHATQLKVSGVEANALQVNLNMAPPGANLLNTLTGRVSVALNDGRLTGVDLSQKLGAIGKFKGVTDVGNGATHVSSLTGDFDIKNGLATTNDLKALTDAGTVAATGSASLANQSLDMKATAVLSKSSSQQVGGNAIGGLMTTALSNSNGEIVIPVIVTGTISQPKVDPDVTAIAQMRMHNLIPSFSNPATLTQLGKLGGAGNTGGALGGVLGALGSKQQPASAASNQGTQQQQQNGNALQNAVGGLGGLFGGKKKSQQPQQ